MGYHPVTSSGHAVTVLRSCGQHHHPDNMLGRPRPPPWQGLYDQMYRSVGGGEWEDVDREVPPHGVPIEQTPPLPGGTIYQEPRRKAGETSERKFELIRRMAEKDHVSVG